MLTEAKKFKETEIGFIPEGWGVFRLGDLTEKIIDNRGKTPPVSDSGYELIETFQISIEKKYPDLSNKGKQKYVSEETYNSWFRAGHPQKGDILFSTVGASIPQWCFIPEDAKYCVAQNLIGLRLNKIVSPEFLRAFFNTPFFKSQVNGIVITTAQPSIKVPHLLDLKIVVPPLDEQVRLADIIVSIEDKIELNRKVNANLETLVGSLFKEWFASTRDKLPEGWKLGKVSDLIKVESGFPFNSNMFDESGQYKLITIKNVQDGYFISECTNSLSKIPSKMPAHCLLKDGDILLSLTGNVGRICLVNGENYLLNQRVAKLIPINEDDRAFVYFLFRQKDFQNILTSISRGTAQQNLSPIETKSLEIVVPSKEALSRFARVANPIFQMVVENYNQITNLSILRDSLLPRLMSGRIRTKPQ